MENKNIIIIGGYGNFGKRIVESMLDLENVTLFIVGRHYEKAAGLCTLYAQRGSAAKLKPAGLDIKSSTFEKELASLNPFLVIHTGGPFQGQGYEVPNACIAMGSHYIDLADDRRFVCDISKLDSAAKESGVLVVSGASSVPGLSSAIIDHYLPKFEMLKTIDFAIAPGNKAERGAATVGAILSYTGQLFKVFRNNKWIEIIGWGESRKRNLGGIVGSRWLANVDVPDLELFPKRYPSVETVQFQAGLEVVLLHHGMSIMAKLAHFNLVKNWAPYTKFIVRASEFFLPFGSDNGAMLVSLSGIDKTGAPLQIDWTLFAEDGVGPYIPTISAILLARKLVDNSVRKTGAMACQGMYSLEEFDGYAKAWGIYHTENASQ